MTRAKDIILSSFFGPMGARARYDPSQHNILEFQEEENNNAPHTVKGLYWKERRRLWVVYRANGHAILCINGRSITLDEGTTATWHTGLNKITLCITRRADMLSVKYKAPFMSELKQLDPAFDELDAEACDFGYWLYRAISRRSWADFCSDDRAV